MCVCVCNSILNYIVLDRVCVTVVTWLDLHLVTWLDVHLVTCTLLTTRARVHITTWFVYI